MRPTYVSNPQIPVFLPYYSLVAREDEAKTGTSRPSTQLNYSLALKGQSEIKTDPKSTTGKNTYGDDECSICLSAFTNKKTLGNRGQGNEKRPTHGSNPQTTGTSRSTTLLNYSLAVKGQNEIKTDPKSTTDKKTSGDDECSICLSAFTNKKTLGKCGHSFCTSCIDQSFQYSRKCPLCGEVYRPLFANQLEGKMTARFRSVSLPEFKSCGAILITYKFEDGVQGKDHPNPGQPYRGTQRTVYLPDNTEGRKVLKLLRKAFEQKLTFAIGRSRTTGAENVVTWNYIHHKTNPHGRATNFGYPDPDYLKRVHDELAAKGITE